MTTHKAKTAKQATIEVLRRAGQPLKSAEIARRALKVKDVRLAGKTPVATVLTRTYRCHGSVRSRNAYVSAQAPETARNLDRVSIGVVAWLPTDLSTVLYGCVGPPTYPATKFGA